MEVLVTGATGFVGANVARLLLADGYRVRVLAGPSSSLSSSPDGAGSARTTHRASSAPTGASGGRSDLQRARPPGDSWWRDRRDRDATRDQGPAVPRAPAAGGRATRHRPGLRILVCVARGWRPGAAHGGPA